MIRIVPEANSNVVHIRVTEHLHKQDYEQFVPKINALVKEHGKVRLLFDLARFHGWSRGALWFGIKYLPEVERVAFVGDKQWGKGVDILCNAFNKAQVRYFDHSHIDQAKAWVREKGPRPDGASSPIFARQVCTPYPRPVPPHSLLL